MSNDVNGIYVKVNVEDSSLGYVEKWVPGKGCVGDMPFIILGGMPLGWDIWTVGKVCPQGSAA